jgi:hypothetical protein
MVRGGLPPSLRKGLAFPAALYMNMRLRLKGVALRIEFAHRKGKPFRTEGGKPLAIAAPNSIVRYSLEREKRNRQKRNKASTYC